jgi:hypothetical protein
MPDHLQASTHYIYSKAGRHKPATMNTSKHPPQAAKDTAHLQANLSREKVKEREREGEEPWQQQLQDTSGDINSFTTYMQQ